MNGERPFIRYVRRNFDEAAILAVAAKVAFERNAEFSESELATIAAMQRAHPQAGHTPQQLGESLRGMDEEQIGGVISNTKGVLHEMEFVHLENEDGDSVYAALFEDTNHAGFDVRFVDQDAGLHWETQLKATGSESYVQSWIDDHPDGQILVTDELATRMGLEGTGLENGELTVRTQDTVDRLLGLADQDTAWDYFPSLTAVSLSLVIWELWERYRRGEITLSRFKWLAARATGLKTTKIALLTLAMMIPGLNVITGAALVASLILSVFGAAQAAQPATTAALQRPNI